MKSITQKMIFDENIKTNICSNDLVDNIEHLNPLYSKTQPNLLSNNIPLNSELSPIAILDSKFSLLKKIGQGSSSKVYLGYKIDGKENDESNNKLYSIKLIDPKKIDIKLYKTEVELLNKISHKNVLKIFDHGIGQKIKRNGKSKEVYYIVNEYLSHDDLLKYVTRVIPGENKGFGEEFGRLIFSQLLDGLEAIHNSNISHRDIKLENIMIGGVDYDFKYVDFGFGAYNNSGKLNTFLGTPAYAAPELHFKKPYYGISEDIFSLGVCLFVLVTGTLPFKLAIPNDSFYQYFVRNDYIGFWRKRLINVSPNFMELFDNLVAFDYTQRPSISEIRQSAWMKEIDWNLLPYLKKELIFREEKIINIRNDIYLKEMEFKKNKKINKNDINKNKPISLLEIKRKRKISENEKKKEICEKNNDIVKNIGLDEINSNSEDNNDKSKEIKSIIIDLKINAINTLICDIKKILKKEGYVPTMIKGKDRIIDISNGKVEIELKFEKIPLKSFVKIYYWNKKGSQEHFEVFQRLMNNMENRIN